MSTSTALTIVGAAAGFAMGGPAGAQWGAMIGGTIGGLMQANATHMRGPRLSDLSVQKSEEGAPIPVLFGAVRVAGNVLQCSSKRERAHKTSAGKGSGPKTTNYTYDVDLAVEICGTTDPLTGANTPIIGVRRIWANGNLIYDTSPGASAASLLASGKVAAGVTIYTGTEAQLPDPTLEALTGVGTTPAYRGKAYVVFTALQLADFGNSIPNFTFEVIASGFQAPYRRLAVATIPQKFKDYYGNQLGVPTIYTANDVVRVGVAGGVGGTTYLYDLDGSYLGQETRTQTENEFPIFQFYESGVWYSGLSRLWDGKPLYIRNYSRQVIGVNPVLITGGAYAIHADASGGLPLGRQLLTSVVSADGRYILSITAPADSLNGSGSGDRWHMTEWTGALAVLVDEGDVISPVSEYWFNRDSYHAGMMESNLEWIWDSYSAGGREITLFRLDRTAKTLSKAKVYSGSGVDSGATLDAFCKPAVWADAGICITVGGNQFNVHTRLPAVEPSQTPLSDVVSKLCTRAGLLDADIDVSRLSDSLHGYAVSTQASARAALEPLRQYAPFDVTEADGKLLFIPRGTSVAATIPWADLAAHDGGTTPEPLELTLADEAEIVNGVTVVFPDPDASYQPSAQAARRNRVALSGQSWQVPASVNEQRTELPICMTPARGARIAEQLLWEAYTARKTAKFAVGIKYAALKPADVVIIVGPDATYRLRITRITEQGLLRQIEAVAEDAALYTAAPASAPSAGVPAQSVAISGPTRLHLLDIPLLRDADDGPGFYAAAGRYLPGWPGATIYASADAGQTWDEVQTFANSATLGSTEDALPAWAGGNVFDESSRVTVRIALGLQLASIAADAVLSGGNAALIGNEIVQFRSAELIGTGLYRLSGLLRGRRGTEWAMAAHAAGERFVLLSGVAGLARVVSTAADIGATRSYKAITAGESLDSASVVDFSDTGVGLKPLAPVHINAGRDAAGNIIITWVRRTRVDGEWRDYADASLGEAAESYEVDILSDVGAVLRTLTTSTPSVVYSADLCISDFGSMVTSIKIRVYQMSAIVGRGFGAEAVLSLSPFSRVVDPFFTGLEPAAGARSAVPLCSAGNKMVMVTVGIKKVSGTGYICRRFFRTSDGITFNQTGPDISTIPLSSGNEYPDNALAAMAPSGDWLGYGAIASSTREFCLASFAGAPVGKGAAFASTDAPLSISHYAGEWYCATKSGAFYKTSDAVTWTLLGTLPAVGPIYRTPAGWLQIRGQQTAENPNVFDPEIHFTSVANGLSGWSRTLSAVGITGNALGGIPYRPSVSGNVVYVDVLGYEFTAGAGVSTNRSMILRSADGGASWSVDMSISGTTVGAWPGAFVPASRGPIHITSGGVFRASPLASSAAQWGQSLRRYGAGDWRIVATTGLPTYAEIDADLYGDNFALVCAGFRRSPVPRVSTDGINFKDPIVILA